MPVDVPIEFIEQNQKLGSKKFPKKGGPYNKNERDQRRQEVYRLHFEYGYSAKKIAELMKVNRNTINGDIAYWYSKIYSDTAVLNPEPTIIINLERLEIQRTRLREQLDKTNSFQEKMSVERMIYDIDCKILHTHTRLSESARRVYDFSVRKMNQWMKENKREERYLTLFDKIAASEKAREKIKKIIKEDKLYNH